MSNFEQPHLRTNLLTGEKILVSPHRSKRPWQGQVEDIQEEYHFDENTDMKEIINKLTEEMLKYAQEMEFEKAAEVRDKIRELEKMLEN